MEEKILRDFESFEEFPDGILKDTAAGTYKIGTPAFDAYAYKYKEFMPKILERQKDWTDVVYHLA